MQLLDQILGRSPSHLGLLTAQEQRAIINTIRSRLFTLSSHQFHCECVDRYPEDTESSTSWRLEFAFPLSIGNVILLYIEGRTATAVLESLSFTHVRPDEPSHRSDHAGIDHLTNTDPCQTASPGSVYPSWLRFLPEP
jgi:hypothetical protein